MRITYEDEFQNKGQMDLNKVVPNDKVRFDTHYKFNESVVDQGEFGLVEYVDINSLVVNTITNRENRSGPEQVIVEPVFITLITTTEDPRVGRNRIGQHEGDITPERLLDVIGYELSETEIASWSSDVKDALNIWLDEAESAGGAINIPLQLRLYDIYIWYPEEFGTFHWIVDYVNDNITSPEVQNELITAYAENGSDLDPQWFARDLTERFPEHGDEITRVLQEIDNNLMSNQPGETQQKIVRDEVPDDKAILDTLQEATQRVEQGTWDDVIKPGYWQNTNTNVVIEFKPSYTNELDETDNQGITEALAGNTPWNNPDYIVQMLGRTAKEARLVQKKNDDTDKTEWALVSKKDSDKVLKWFGGQKPSKETVDKEEQRVQYFKHKGDVEEIAAMEEEADFDKKAIDVHEMEQAVQKLYERGVLITDPEAVTSGIRSYMVELMRDPGQPPAGTDRFTWTQQMNKIQQEKEQLIPILRQLFSLVKNTTPENWQEFVASIGTLPPVQVEQMLEGTPPTGEHPESFMVGPHPRKHRPSPRREPEEAPGLPMQEEPLPAPPESAPLAEEPLPPPEEVVGPEPEEEALETPEEVMPEIEGPEEIRIKTPRGKGKELATAKVGDEVYSQMAKSKGVGVIREILSPEEVMLELVNRRTKEPIPSRPDKPNPTVVPVDKLWHSQAGRWSSKIAARDIIVMELFKSALTKISAIWEESAKLGHRLSVTDAFAPFYHGGQLDLDPKDGGMYTFQGAHFPEVDENYDVPNPELPNPEGGPRDISNVRARLEAEDGQVIFLTFDEFATKVTSEEKTLSEEEYLRQEEEQLESLREQYQGEPMELEPMQFGEEEKSVGPHPGISGREPTVFSRPLPVAQ